MRQAFAHDATVEMGPADDPAAIGAAVTVALCGDLDHAPPCPFAPHHTRTERDGRTVRVRILFAVEQDQEDVARRRIVATLASGAYAGRIGAPDTTWQLVDEAPSPVRDDEADHGARLIRS